jgi:NAD-dependent deacetylase
VWTRDPDAEKYSTIGFYLSDPDIRRRAWLRRLDNPAWTAVPNAGHRALVDLERAGRLHLLVTQNIDGLHQRAGNSPERVVEMHGSIREVHCVDCGERGPMAPVLERVRSGELDPRCGRCTGILKSTTVFFGEALDPDDMVRAQDGVAGCDLLLAVGSTLGVYPVAALVPRAAARGVPVVILNGGPTEQDELADVVVRGSISELLPALVAHPT